MERTENSLDNDFDNKELTHGPDHLSVEDFTGHSREGSETRTEFGSDGGDPGQSWRFWRQKLLEVNINVFGLLAGMWRSLFSTGLESFPFIMGLVYLDLFGRLAELISFLKLKWFVVRRGTIFTQNRKDFMKSLELIAKVAYCCNWQDPKKAVSGGLAIVQIVVPYAALGEAIEGILVKIVSSSSWNQFSEKFTNVFDYAMVYLGQADDDDEASEDQNSKTLEFEKAWAQVADSDLGMNLMHLLALLVTAGFLPEQNISYQNLELFSVKAAKESVKAKDFASACYGLVKTCARGVEEYRNTGSFEGFFNRESLEAEVSYAISLYQQVLVGNLMDYANMTNSAYACQMNKYKDKLEKKIRDPKCRDKVMYKTYLDRVNDVISSLASIEMEQKMQEQAFGVMFHGSSSVGKSWFAIPLIKWLLMINKYEHEDCNIITYNTQSKYDDQVRNDTFGILLDDLANAKPSNGGDTRRTSDLVISLINNVSQAAVKADLAEKGKVMMKPKIVVATTNNRNLNAEVESTNPASIRRRFKYEVEFIVKPEFCVEGSTEIDGNKVRSAFPGKQFPNVWDFRITKCHISTGGKGAGFVMKHVFNPYSGGKIFEIKDFMRFMRDESRIHFEQERASLELRKSQKAIEVNEESLPSELFEGQALEDFFGFSSTLFQGDPIEDEVEMPNMEVMTDIMRVYHTWRGTAYVSNVPPLIMNLWVFSNFNVKVFVGLLFSLSVVPVVTLFVLPTLSATLLGFIVMLLEAWYIRGVTVATLARTIALTSVDYRMRTSWRRISTSINESNLARNTMFGVFGLTGLYFISKLLSNAYGAQSLDPKNAEEVEKKISSSSLWTVFRGIAGNTAGGKTLTMTSDHLQNVARGNLAYVQVEKENGKFRGSNALFVCKGYLLLPYHFFKQCAQVFKLRVNRNGHVEEVLVDTRVYNGRRQWIMVAEDLVMVRLTGVNRSKDITELFSARLRDDPISNAVQIISDGNQEEYNRVYNLTKRAERYSFQGDKYICNGYRGKSEAVPVAGMCMSPIIVDSKAPEIIGVHIAGHENSRQLLVLAVTQEMVRNAIVELDEVCTFQHIDDTAAFKAHADSCISKEIHPFCATRFASNELPIDIIGSVPGSGPRRFSTQKTPYHNYILEKFNIENPYDIPKSTAKVVDGELFSPWKNCIEELNQARNLIPYTLLERAREEIVAKFSRKLKSYEKGGGVVRPLNIFEAINGIPEKAGMEGMKMATSAGIKYGGVKSKHLKTEIHPYEFAEYVTEDVIRLRETLANKERGVNTLNASLKDEPLKKKKVVEYRTRVFFADEIDSLIVCSQLFSPILAYLRTFPEMSHCAIGLNAQSHDWEKVLDYLTDNGRISHEDGLCLDFKAFDKTLPENLMKFAWQVLIDLAKQMPGYTENDIRMMQSMADEKTTPFIRMNGTLFQLNFDHTSGNLCTAAVGSIAGLMLLLIGFYEVEDKRIETSSKGLDYIRSVHLGDDLMSTLDQRHKLKFNFLTLQEVLSGFGITITMPDKEAEPTSHQNIMKEDFLKRMFRWCEDRSSYCGVLDKSSMYKSLLYYTPSDVETRNNQLGQSLSAILIEAALYGREYFEEIHELVIYLKNKWYLNVPNLMMSYDERVIAWARDSGKRHLSYQTRPKPFIDKITRDQHPVVRFEIFGEGDGKCKREEHFISH